MKTVYIAHAMTHGNGSLDELNELAAWLRHRRIRVLTPAYNLFPDVLAVTALQAMEKTDLLIADVSSRSHGVGFELGYAFAHKKNIILVAKASVKAHVSKFLCGLFPKAIFYGDGSDLIQNVSILLSEFSIQARRKRIAKPRKSNKREVEAKE